MNHWHYQIMRHKVQDPTPLDDEEYYAIHEYYPMEEGAGWTQDPIAVEASSVEELRKTLLLMLHDIDKHGGKDYE